VLLLEFSGESKCIRLYDILMRCSYKTSGEKMGFCTYIADQITDLMDYFTNNRAERGIPVPMQDESLHSSHSMMTTKSSTLPDRPPSIELSKPSERIERIRGERKPARSAGGSKTAQLRSGLGASRAGSYSSVQQNSEV